MIKIICHTCKNIIQFNTHNIPEGSKYNFKCPKCGKIIIEKK